jgi:5-histidylcysteine sulfoxide synthase/putative 4-mercaptohistidine N1-methyltranferase
MRTLFLDGESISNKRQELLLYFQHTFSLYESLFELLRSDEAYYQIADPLRHPLIFYFAHTAVFFVNKLLAAKLVSTRIHPQFESLFSVGVDEMAWDDLNKTVYEWPSVQAIKTYRNTVRTWVSDFIMTMPLKLPICFEDPAWIILMGIEHERIHLETSSVLIRQLPLESVQASSVWKRCQEAGRAPINQMILIGGKKIVLGKSFHANTYGWDNEYGTACFTVPDFKASQFLVSNEEFHDFILAGGYQNKNWWSNEGAQWSCDLKAKMPRFWRKKGDEYYLRLLTEEIPMPWNWPVEINYLEANAFCRFKSQKNNRSIRLPTEAEWYVMRELVDVEYPYWDAAPGNINLEYDASPCPVDCFKQGVLYDVIGNVWQWTETPIKPYVGFRAHPAYDDFSIPTFDGEHHLIKGGSWISTGNEVLKESRYAFRRHFYQHAGFRYVESDQQHTVEDRNDNVQNDQQHKVENKDCVVEGDQHYKVEDRDCVVEGDQHYKIENRDCVVEGDQHYKVENRDYVVEGDQQHKVENTDYEFENDQQYEVDNRSYESDQLLSEYLEFHFGEDYFNVKNYSKTIVNIALSAKSANAPQTMIGQNSTRGWNKALDLGCSVGRAAFELSQHFDCVYGVDFSTRFINAAVKLQRQGHIKYRIATEGELYDYRKATLEGIQITPKDAEHIRFIQGDACNLAQHLKDFDLIIAANLIDRLYDPDIFLRHIHERLNIGGILVISSPYTWLEDYTEKSKWLGGIKQKGKSITTLCRLETILSKHFVKQSEPKDVEFVIRETNRKFQHSIAEVTVWRRVSHSR